MIVKFDINLFMTKSMDLNRRLFRNQLFKFIIQEPINLVVAVEFECGHSVRGELLLKGGTVIAGLFILGALLSPKKR
jgi:hypothetical protein